MCGICGIVDLNGKKVERDLIEQMSNEMVHRGPDDSGLFLDGPVGLGHRRLSIIDLKTGQQPMFNEDGTVVVVFNGEIYNFADIKSDLVKKGHRFKTNSDTEVIVHAFEEMGTDCVDLFRGMFAIAVYDCKTRELFLARDRLGIKPLYYFKSRDVFIFASEIKAILKSGFYLPAVNLDVVDCFIRLGYVPGEQTAFEGIKKIQPGFSGVFKSGKLELKEYWDVKSFGQRTISIRQAGDRLNELLKDTVRLHLISDVPVGVFLSGGLDSSSIVAYAKNLVDGPVKTFTVGYYDDPKSSELHYARLVAKHFQTEHFEYILTSEDFFESIDLFLNYVEEPVVESAGIALLRLAEYARREVVVLLSGEGADEIFAGYPLYRIMSWIEMIKPLASMFPRSFASLLVGLKFAGEKKHKYLDWIYQPLNERYRTISCDVTQSIQNEIYREDFAKYVDNVLPRLFGKLFNKIKNGSGLQKMLYVDMKTWLPEDLLIKADKMTMAASVELRVPFLDHKVVEFAASLPDRFKLKGLNGKFLLREVMKSVLPKEIIHRKKMGFPVPISKWFRGSIYDQTRNILLDKKSLSRGYFTPKYIEKILQRHHSGLEDLGRRIFSLLVFELWHRKFIDA